MTFIRGARALAGIHICIGSPEPSYLDNGISIKSSCAGSNGDLSVIYASNEDSRKSAHLH